MDQNISEETWSKMKIINDHNTLTDGLMKL